VEGSRHSNGYPHYGGSETWPGSDESGKMGAGKKKNGHGPGIGQGDKEKLPGGAWDKKRLTIQTRQQIDLTIKRIKRDLREEEKKKKTNEPQGPKWGDEEKTGRS